MTIGVLVMSYGTPVDRDDIVRYYTDIRRGRKPTDAEVGALAARYDAIGGTFPLRAATEAQADALHAALGSGFDVTVGNKHAPPFIEDGVRTLAERRVDRLVGIVMAPHYSALSIGEYVARARSAAEALGLPLRVVESWHQLPAYLDFLRGEVQTGLAQLPTGSVVVFTAHALPVRVLPAADPYPEQVIQTATHVAAPSFRVAWQSAPPTTEPWLTPHLPTVLRSIATGGAPGVLLCACGFVADHLEVLYDLDIEAAALARDLGLAYARTRSVGTDAAVMAALADEVRAG